MQNIEVEVRSFITQNEYKKLVKKLNKEANFVRAIEEETIYLSGPRDLRLRKDSKNSFIILKDGKIHDRWRGEIEIKCGSQDFEKIEKLFQRLGNKRKIRWLRKRRIYKSNNINIFLDFTEGYGYIIELEKLTDKGQKEITQRRLKNKLKSLGIKITPKKEFEKRLNYYKQNWKKILKYK